MNRDSAALAAKRIVVIGGKQLPLPGGRWELVFTLTELRNWGSVGSLLWRGNLGESEVSS